MVECSNICALVPGAHVDYYIHILHCCNVAYMALSSNGWRESLIASGWMGSVEVGEYDALEEEGSDKNYIFSV